MVTLKKVIYIERYGEVAYAEHLQQCQRWAAQHRKKHNAAAKAWREANPNAGKEWCAANTGKVLANNQEGCRKGGKRYVAKLKYQTTGLQGERHRIRSKHAKLYHDIKQATPNSVFHHEWIPGTAKYRGVALVDKEAHQNGIIKVINVLEGKITLFTEKKIAEQGGKI